LGDRTGRALVLFRVECHTSNPANTQGEDASHVGRAGVQTHSLAFTLSEAGKQSLFMVRVELNRLEKRHTNAILIDY